MTTALLVIGILVLLIVGHEFGHFIAAKIFKVHVEEFGIGYPPRAVLFGKIKETEYTLNWIPFGGFVRLFGDEGDARHGAHSFLDAKRPVQAVILVAGVLANTVLAWALFAGALSLGVPRVVDAVRPSERAQLVVADVVAGSPADAAGIASGDEVIGVRDSAGLAPPQLNPADVSDFVSSRAGRQIIFSYARAGASTTVTLRPAHAVITDEAGRPAIGVALVLVSDKGLPLSSALKESFFLTKDAFATVGNGLWKIIRDTLHGSLNLRDIVGPVGLIGVVSDAAAHGMGNVLALAGFISVNLAIINLIPIPALDGGRLVLLGVESAMRRNAPRLIVQILNALGVALIAILMITVTYHDIARLFG